MNADERELLRRIKDGDRFAEEQLCERYYDYVEAMSRPYYIVGAERDDIVQIGMIGLMRAARSYDSEKEKSSFKTYATRCIRNAILDGVRESNAQKNAALNSSAPLTADGGDGADLIDILPSSARDPETEYLAKEAEEAFFDALSTVFNETDLNILKLYLASMPYKEISDTLGVTAKKVDNTIYNAKKKIEKLITRLKND